MAHEPQQKWEGKASAKLIGHPANQVWPLFEDFLTIHKWLPGVDTCNLVEGVPGQPGCIRYCSGTAVPSDGIDEAPISWVKENLLSIDSIQRCISYEVIEGNIGFENYIATIKLVSVEDQDGQSGSEIEWSFVVDPIKGWRFEDLVSYVDSSVHAIAKRMEEALEASK
ncbi:Polyketide cyclase/dehydrase [Macleaya cordata]|uniref:Polyketide cyclase/dehydrase n=1 Tax=Macleaya cordata TaxID=56857 RepID=A0A200RC03_MACCD|nr:Polyketide cyclase/dehydrase [Macleaya cordata]